MKGTGLGSAVRYRADSTLEDDTGDRGDHDNRLEVRLEEEGDEGDGGEVDTVDVDCGLARGACAGRCELSVRREQLA